MSLEDDKELWLGNWFIVFGKKRQIPDTIAIMVLFLMVINISGYHYLLMVFSPSVVCHGQAYSALLRG